MRRTLLASAAVAAAISVPVTLAGTAQAATAASQQTTAKATTATTAAAAAAAAWNRAAASKARQLVGLPYRYGGTSTAGFDCSGLTQWVYHHTGRGKAIDRIANDQFHEFRRISHAAARPGDLVFFHETTNPASYVYHVGVYEGGEMMVAAATYGEGVKFQSFAWAGNTVTFGTITH